MRLRDRNSVITLFLALECLPMTFAQDNIPGVERASIQEIKASVDGGLLTASIRNQPLRRVLEELSVIAHFTVAFADEVEDKIVSLEAKRLRLDDSIRQLLSDYDAFLFYGGTADKPAWLRAVWVYQKGGGSHLRPVPPEVWASGKELEARISNPDPEKRLLAYESLFSRPDPSSRDLVIDALAGKTERDHSVRQRLFSVAITKGFSLPPEVLADLALRDPSEQIRWLALDVLSEHSSAKQTAEAAILDPNEAIREKAKQILADLQAADHRRTHPQPGSEDQP
jgi:hypothetical protein